MHHILVVDDDKEIRAVIAEVLADEGFGVVTVGNGTEALERIAENWPVLVLLDLQMPVMTGWEVLTHLRDAGVAVPVVFMSAGYRAKAEAECEGAEGYIAKPFDLHDLITMADRFASRLPDPTGASSGAGRDSCLAVAMGNSPADASLPCACGETRML
jgi:CheY-like chemotaxis protein